MKVYPFDAGRCLVQSESHKETMYMVGMDDDGTWFCDCPDQRTRGVTEHGHLCKHIRKVKGILERWEEANA